MRSVARCRRCPEIQGVATEGTAGVLAIRRGARRGRPVRSQRSRFGQLRHRSRSFSRVERWRGGRRPEGSCCRRLSASCRCLSSYHSSVSTSRSSNRTCGFPASGFRTGHHAFAHGKLRVRSASRTKPSSWYRDTSGKRETPRPGTLCLRHSHWRSLRQAWRSTAA